MLALDAPVVANSPTTRGVFWVLRAAVAAVAIAAWLAVLLHLVLVVRAERKLAQIAQQANAFAELPRVDSRELGSYVQRRLATAGFAASRVQVVADAAQPGRWKVAAIETTAEGALPRGLRPLWWWASERVITTTPGASPSMFYRQTE